MQKVVFFGLLLTASASCSVEFGIGRGYHEEIGIPLAKSIKAAEEGVLDRQRRTVGGDVVPPHAYPFVAGLLITLMNSYKSMCTASLVSHNRVVTAAHCWFDGRNRARRLTVVLGTNKIFSGGTRIGTSSVTMHPQWKPHSMANDIAVIYLPRRVQFSPIIQPIALPSNELSSKTFVGEWATATGYGRTSDLGHNTRNPVLNHVKLQVINQSQCRAAFRNVFSSTLCTSGKGRVGICHGDSGGPLFVIRNGHKVLIGISSFGLQEKCQWGWPSGFTRVTSFQHFIRQHL